MFQNTAKKLYLWCTLLTWILTSCHIFLRMFKLRKNCDFVSRTGASFCHLSLTSGIKPVDGHHQKCLTDLYRHKLHIVWLLMQAIFDTTKPKKIKSQHQSLFINNEDSRIFFNTESVLNWSLLDDCFRSWETDIKFKQWDVKKLACRDCVRDL